MNEDTAQKAVQKALKGNWDEAIKLNKEILKEDSKDIDALNRLARAYAEKGNFKEAKNYANKVLKIDSFNTIATKALKKWSTSTKLDGGKSKTGSPQAFLEEPGKTKLTTLLHLGDAATIAALDTGDELEINSHQHRVNLVTSEGKYVGRLADDLAARMKKLLKYGNKYQVLVKSIEPEEVKVFIREIKRAEKLKDIPSFSSDKIDYVSFTPPQLVHKKETVNFEDEE